MDLEKRLYEALAAHKTGSGASRLDLFRKPPVGSIRETELGPIWMVETVYDEGYLHGKIELSSRIPKSAVGYLDQRINPDHIDLPQVAVIDTETTGLAGGTGTYPFILGIGFFLDRQFVVRQYILRDFCEEPSQLRAFSDDLRNTSWLLTYNGKTFDIPLLRTRYRINRMPIPFADFAHIDMVHPCRRLYRRHFHSFQLSNLEAHVVGYERVDDVPSHLIPYIYFDYLQTRDDNLLLPILNHNRDDIVSLYMLSLATAGRIELALDGGCQDDLFLMALARISFDKKDYERTKFLVQSIKSDFAPRDIADEALFLRSVLAKRIRNWSEANDIWREMLGSGKFGCHPYIELAKHFEHRDKDPKSALEMTDAALRLLEFERAISSSTALNNLQAALKRRYRRLINKIRK